ncbi:MAG: DUF2382 domain-containing protein [Kofleriaceae bacterium]
MSDDLESQPPPSASAVEDESIATVPVIAERAIVTKDLVEVARTVLTKTVSEEAQTVDTMLSRDDVHVERVPVNVYVDEAPPVRIEGETTIFPVMREVAVVVTKLLVVEEVRITRRIVQHVDRQVIPTRVEHVTVERVLTSPRSKRDEHDH